MAAGLPPEVAARLRDLPAVDEVAERLVEGTPHSLRVEAARSAIDEARARLIAGEPSEDLDAIVRRAEEKLQHDAYDEIRPVLNATGVLVHTNLGRVPLGERQLARAQKIAASYTNLEYDLNEGTRGSRYGHSSALLRRLTGAEDALVVNNNAAAVLLVLSSLCSGREVVISRGELVEIGGEFRIPDVMAASGALLREVGTTNRTHLADYERAISPDTGALMKVHTSSYKIVGFAKNVDRRTLGKLARGRGVPFIEDLGSGLMEVEDAPRWLADEPPVRASIDSGADVVTFSGDKLLGGPQAGIIAGRSELISRIKKNPLLRTVRVDKLTLACLQVTLEAYLDGTWRELPFWQMALADAATVERRVRSVIAEVEARESSVAKLEAVPTSAVAGGGSLPDELMASWGVAISHPERSADELHSALRRAETPIIGRIENDRLLLDLRTVHPDMDSIVSAQLAALAD